MFRVGVATSERGRRSNALGGARSRRLVEHVIRLSPGLIRGNSSSPVNTELISSRGSTLSTRRTAIGERVDGGSEGTEARATATSGWTEPVGSWFRCGERGRSWGSSRRSACGGTSQRRARTAQRHRMNDALGDAERLERCLQEVGDGWFGPTAPRTSEDTVIPSWAVVSIARMSRPHMTVLVAVAGAARRLDLAAAHGDQGELPADEEFGDERERAHSSRRAITAPLVSIIAAGRSPADGRGPVIRRDRRRGGAAPRPRGGSNRRSRCDRRSRDAIEAVGDESGEGLVRSVMAGRPRSSSWSVLASPSACRTARPSSLGSSSMSLAVVDVVLVRDVPDDLLDDVLQGDDPDRVPVLVEDAPPACRARARRSSRRSAEIAPSRQVRSSGRAPRRCRSIGRNSQHGFEVDRPTTLSFDGPVVHRELRQPAETGEGS